LSGTGQETAGGFGPQDSLRSRLKRGITWNVAGSLFSQAILFLCNVVLANILGRTGYGEYGMIQNTILTLAGVAMLGTGYTATKHVAEFRFTDKEKTGRILGICSVVTGAMACLATLVIIVAAPFLAATTLKAPHLGTGLLIASGSVLFSVLNGYQMGALAGLESYRAIARLSSLHGLLQLSICSAAAWFWGVNGALAGFAASSLLRWLMFSRALARACGEQGIPLARKGIWSEREVISKFALPAALCGLFAAPALWIVNTFLVRLPDGYSQMGLYSAAGSLRTVIIYVPQLVNNVGMSMMNSQKGLGDQESYRKLFWFNLKLTACLVLSGALVIALFGGWILRIFGKDFVGGYTVLLILVVSAIPEALALAAFQVIQSRSKMWLTFTAIVLPRDCTNMLAAYFLIPLFGAAGMASAYVLSQLVALASTVAIAYRLGIGFPAAELSPVTPKD